MNVMGIVLLVILGRGFVFVSYLLLLYILSLSVFLGYCADVILLYVV